MLRKLRRAGKPATPDSAVQREDTAIRASVPSPFGGEPLLQLAVRLHSEQQGERSVLKMHASLDSALNPTKPTDTTRALSAPDSSSETKSLARLSERVASRAAESLASLPVVQRLAGRLHSEWVVTASTHELPKSDELVPGAMAKLGFGQAPLARSHEPVVEVSETQGDDGTSNQMGLLRLRKEHLPPALAEALGELPFNLSAAWLTQIQKR